MKAIQEGPRTKPLRILHCPTMVGGNPQELARAERGLGLDSHAVAFAESPLQYMTDEILWKKTDSRVIRELKRWQFFWRALRDFDVIHFNFGESMMPKWAPGAPLNWSWQTIPRLLQRLARCCIELIDLPLLKLADKGIVVTWQGDDARQEDFCRKHFAINMSQCVGPGYYSPEGDRHKRWRIRTFGRFADRIFAVNPDLLHVLPAGAEFVPYASVDWRKWTPLTSRPPRERRLVLHAPTHRGAKGTPIILETVERLRRNGLAFDFVLVENMAHEEARRLYASADLVIDQLLAGWYGAFAVEVMALAIPVLCYVRQEDLHYLPQAMRRDLPLIQATPQTLETVLGAWLTRPSEELRAQGERSREFVCRWHDPQQIASRMKSVYEAIRKPPRSNGADPRKDKIKRPSARATASALRAPVRSGGG